MVERKSMVSTAVCMAIVCLFAGACARNQPQLPYPYGQTYGQPATGVVPGAAVGAPLTPVPSTTAPNPAAVPPGAAAVPTQRALPNIQRPQWGSPGSVAEQRRQAQIFDPYGDNDAGPEIVGGRPRDFQRPLAQPARATTFPGGIF